MALSRAASRSRMSGLLGRPPTTISAWRSTRRLVDLIDSALCRVRQLYTQRGFELSGLRLDSFGQPLTNSYNRQVRRGEKASGDAAGVQSWATMKNAETKGERENARNHGQSRACGNGYAVNKLRGKRCREWVWLLR